MFSECSYVSTELTKHNIKIPSDMVFNLMILHSYILVKVIYKLYVEILFYSNFTFIIYVDAC